MGRYALGKAWDQAAQAERKDFLAAFEIGIVTAYLRRMRIYRGGTMSFAGARPSSGDERLGASRLKSHDSEEIWIWTLRPSAQSWRIVDVAIGGGIRTTSATTHPEFCRQSRRYQRGNRLHSQARRFSWMKSVTQSPLIALEHVGREFDGGRVTALKDVNLEIAKGELLSIVGTSGSGKTTLIMLMCGMMVPK